MLEQHITKLTNEKDFSVLYNMVQELTPLGIDPLSTFHQYKAFLKRFEEIHDQVIEFGSFDYVFNMPNDEVLDAGAIFASIHFSEYFRFIITTLPQLVYGKNTESVFNLLISEHSLALENSSGASEQLHTRTKVQFLVAENPTVGFSIYKALHKRQSLLVFLDADIGTGENNDPLETPFLYHKVNVRRGLFTLAERLGKPIIPIVATSSLGKPALHFGSPLYIQNDAHEAAQTTFKFFSKFVLTKPAQWTQWPSHNDRSLQRENFALSHEKGQGRSIAVLERADEHLSLDLLTGELFIKES